jgi:hypothetical protein
LRFFRAGKTIYVLFHFVAESPAVTFGEKRMEQLTEYSGYAASALVLISFLMKDLRKLRIVNSAGCLLFILYGVLLGSIPVVVTNVSITLINVYYLLRAKSAR